MALEHLKRWQIGAVEVVRIVEIDAHVRAMSGLFLDGDERTVLRHDWLQPRFATAEGKLLMSFQAFALKCGERRILVDTCVGNLKPRRAPHYHLLQTSFLQDLMAAGFPPESIDTVLCTHLHLDHVGWNTRLIDGQWVPTFPNARYLLSRREWDYLVELQSDPSVDLNHFTDSLQPVMAAGLVDFVEPQHRITDAIALEPTPGHTPGHVSVRISSEGEHAVITGDLIHHPVQCAEPALRTKFCVDHELARHTRREFLRRYQDREALVIGSHFCEPTAGWIERDGEVWKFVT